MSEILATVNFNRGILTTDTSIQVSIAERVNYWILSPGAFWIGRGYEGTGLSFGGRESVGHEVSTTVAVLKQFPRFASSYETSKQLNHQDTQEFPRNLSRPYPRTTTIRPSGLCVQTHSFDICRRDQDAEVLRVVGVIGQIDQ